MKITLIFFVCLVKLSVCLGQEQIPVDSCKIFGPNIITKESKTPGAEFVFKIQSNCKLQEFELTIYNRWGNKLFESDAIEKQWDASKTESGTYYWIIKGMYVDGPKIEKTGIVTLVK